ncbi:hypothetical protein HanRHA438_Chr13g0579491 [Helianthus annuus]|nr:hypothetical protein HanIR_Chr13g0618731 [Helianthus annuus]KAJ0847607.1 hypothetical protein HanPSC8_Chr13g0547191 [Helianthus annuus]KAJ0856531.1 hypothetical protein HanRHA438_Chr13g0579491 [Helianthus annuus]
MTVGSPPPQGLLPFHPDLLYDGYHFKIRAFIYVVRFLRLFFDLRDCRYLGFDLHFLVKGFIIKVQLNLGFRSELYWQPYPVPVRKQAWLAQVKTLRLE